MNLYNESINEFVNWTSGRNEKTGSLITPPDTKISGQSIRNLLQDHLKKPFIVKDYESESVQRIFSSDDARLLWELDRDANADLLLLEIPRKNIYSVTTSYTSETRYTTKANMRNESVLSFSWDTVDDSNESIGDDNLSVTCTITDGENKKSTFPKNFSYDLHSDSQIDFIEYLTEGYNTIELKFTSLNTGAYITRRLNIEVLLLELTCDFRYYNAYTGDGITPLPLNSLALKRNDTNNNDIAHVHLFIDNDKLGEYDVHAPLKLGDISQIETNIINNFSEGTHIIQIIATLVKNGKQFYSNILYYVFVNTSQQAGSAGKYIPLKCSVDSGNILFSGISKPINTLCITATQYLKSYFNWAYLTDAIMQTSSDITWKLEYPQKGISDVIKTVPVEKGVEPNVLEFIPNFYTEGSYAYLTAYDSDSEVKLSEIQLVINLGPVILETSGYTLKLSAFGKDNNSILKDKWIFRSISGNEISTEFSSGIEWNDSSGWYNNSLRLHGRDQYAIISYAPFTVGVNNTRKSNITETGEAIEFEFETEKIVDANNDVLLLFGNENRKHIKVRPNRATLYDGNTILLETNYKTNERLKLCFIINKIPNSGENETNDSGLSYIINNGILERAKRTGTLSTNSSGNIKIGGSDSGLRLYSIRCYPTSISYNLEYNNFVYDSDDKTTIINRNDILVNGVIDFEKCCERMDTILIRGDIPSLLATSNKSVDMNVTIERYCPSNSSFNFICTDCRIRKHGQSTLNYPVPSMKFWFNKSATGSNKTPIFTCEGQSSLGLGKNRYKMKPLSIPSNKFVLQANYADSSGVHNGGIMLAIQNSWYNSLINGQYKLRTEPLLFSTNELYIREDNTNATNNDSWNKHVRNISFPHRIEVAPDSFPCVVFYEDVNQGNKIIFLGQYVFMEDKKSDFCFGERSIYNVPTDPFCLTVEHANEDIEGNLLWDNKNVLRIEGIEFNTKFSSFLDYSNERGSFNQIIETQATSTSPIVRKYNWETDFELIYPDSDDIEKKDSKNGKTKFDSDSKFASTVKPWIDFYKWVTDTKNNYNNQTDWWNANTYLTPLEAFKATAAQHLDLYKLAAYYITCIRLGLVDSMERNAQYKTYDGQHWHMEPWDMDIALGNINTGGIEFNPPIDRTTMDSHGAPAFAGGGNPPRNWLWNALENWSYWTNTIVTDVASALDANGFNYKNLTKIFDEDYLNKWCERIYNESGYYKYVILGGKQDAMLGWLLGARTTHRHWWLNASMNFYDSKWGVGDFIKRTIRSWTSHDLSDPTGQIIIYPNERTFFKVGVSNDGGTSIDPMELSISEAFRNQPFEISLANKNLGLKSVLFIFGASYIESLDLSSVALSTTSLYLDGAYSPVSGPSLRKLNIGSQFTKINENEYSGKISVATGDDFKLVTSDVNNNIDNVLSEIVDWNIQGQKFTQLEKYINEGNYTRLKNFYSKGARILNFYSAEDGNSFENIELSSEVIIGQNEPQILKVINLKDTSWENLSFWKSVSDDLGNATITRVMYNGEPAVPSTIEEMRLTGTTASSNEALNLIKGWIESIKREELEKGLDKYSLFGEKVLLFENLKWDGATFEDLEALSKFNEGQNNSNNNYGGIIILDNSQLTNELVKTIRIWFGENVFSKRSKFAIDSRYDRAIINVGEPAYLYEVPLGGMSYITATGDTVVLEEGTEITVLLEGNSASLNATKFGFLESDNTYTYSWAIAMPGGGGGNSYELCLIYLGLDGQFYLQANESQHEDGYFVELSCTAHTLGNEIITPTPVVIYITSVIYPKSTSIEYHDTNPNLAINNNVRNYLQKIDDIITKTPVIPSINPFVEFYIKFNYEGQENSSAKASIQSVTFKIENTDDDSVVLLPTNYTLLKQIQPEDSNSNIDEYIKLYNAYSDDPEYKYSICIKNTGNWPSTLVNYLLTATIIYNSSKKTVLLKPFIVMNDERLLFNPSILNTAVGEYLSRKYLSEYEESPELGIMFKTHLMSITGEIDMSNSVTLYHFRTLTNESVFNYLYNVTNLIFDNCTNINATDSSIVGEDKRVFRLGNMKKLTDLSLLNCTSLSGEFDLNDTSTSLNNVTISNPGVLTKIIIPNRVINFTITDNSRTENLSLLSACVAGNIFSRSFVNGVAILLNLNAYEAVDSSIIDTIYNAITKSSPFYSYRGIKSSIDGIDSTIDLRRFEKVATWLGGNKKYTVNPSINEFLINCSYNARSYVYSIPTGNYTNNAKMDTVSTGLLPNATKFKITADMCTIPHSSAPYYRIFNLSNRLINFGNVTTLDLDYTNNYNVNNPELIVATQACFSIDDVASFWETMTINNDVYDKVLLYMPKVVTFRFNNWGQPLLTTFGLRINVLYLGSSITTIYTNNATKVNILIINKSTVPTISGVNNNPSPISLYRAKKIYVPNNAVNTYKTAWPNCADIIYSISNLTTKSTYEEWRTNRNYNWNIPVQELMV